MLISVLMRLSSGHFMITDQQTVRRHWSGFGVFGGRREYPQASILGLVTKLWFDQGLDLAKYTIMPILIQNAKITESRISIFQIPKKKKKKNRTITASSLPSLAFASAAPVPISGTVDGTPSYP